MIPIAYSDIDAARQRIAGHAHRTPVMTSGAIDRIVGGSLLFKCENFQRTGSFKFRGAVNAVATLLTDVRARGVLTHSSGNHAQALALAARLHDIPAHIVMPENAPETKVRATLGYGGHVTFCPPTHRGRRETAERVHRETGATFVSAHDDLRVIAGQGTALCELVEDGGPLDVVLVPVGGGGLIAGTLIAARKLLPDAAVIGCEPAGADDAHRGLQVGRRIVDFTPDTIADGLRTPLGEHGFQMLRAFADRVVTVSESAIVEAMRLVWERMKIVIEPSSAVAVAPLLERSVAADGRRIGVILTGGNVDLSAAFATWERRAAG